MYMIQLRRAGLVAFVIGVIVFLGDRYVISIPYYLASVIAPKSQAAFIAVSATLLFLRVAAIGLIIAGAAMFLLGRRQGPTDQTPK